MKLFIAFLAATVLLASNAYAIGWTSEGSAAPTSGSQYSPAASYSFYATLASSGEPVSVLLESNFFGSLSNTTVTGSDTYFVNMTALPAGNYLYRWYAINDSYQASTGQISYIVNKNSSAIGLYLNGTEGNRTYLLGSIANVTAVFDVSNFTISSNHSEVINGTYGPGSITFPPNVTIPGTYFVTASWIGNENYLPSSKTYYFGDTAPRYSSISSNPAVGSAYSSGVTYTFSIAWSSCIPISSVRFESNHTGSVVSYTAPNVTNSSSTYTISLPNLPAGSFSYRWIASDSIGRTNSTDAISYNILKATPLQIQVTPSTVNVTAGTNVTVRCLLTNGQMAIDSFKLYRDSTEIANDTYYSKTDMRTFDIGTYRYVCNTTGSQNFTNQSLSYIVNVTSNQTIEKTFKVVGDSSIAIVSGEVKNYSFSIENNMGYTLSNLSVYVNGLDTNWYTIGDIASSVPNNFSIQGKVTFSIPDSVSDGSHTFTIRVTGRSASGQTNETTKSVVLNINVPQQQTLPPTYSPDDADTSANGNTYEFALKWVDDSGLAGYIFSSNVTGVWINDTLVNISGTEGWSYAQKTVTPGSSVAWKFFMVDSEGLWSGSEEFVLTAQKSGTDFGVIGIVVVIIAVVTGVLFFVTQRKHLPIFSREKVEYVYSRNDAK